MSFNTISIQKGDHIAKITLNLPETRNAVNLQMRAELVEVFREISDEDDIKAVVLTGAGKAFCSGGDLLSMEGLTAVSGRVRLKKGQRLIKTMFELEKPIVAAINGGAAGPGISIAMACDILIASEKAKFAFTFVKVGLVPDWGGFYLLPLRVGMTRAKELMLTGRSVDAFEAKRIGLVNRVVSHEKLEQEAFSWAKQFISGPSQSYAMIISALNKWPGSLDYFLEMESTMQAVAFSSRDFEEGRKAFLGKREPIFQGK